MQKNFTEQLLCSLLPIIRTNQNRSRRSLPVLYPSWNHSEGPRRRPLLAPTLRIRLLPGPRGGFLTVYILAPVVGAVLGGGLYDRLLRPALPEPCPEKGVP